MPSVTIPAAIAIGTSIVGAGVSTLGALDQGAAASHAAKFNAAVAGANSVVSKQNASFAANAGEEQAAISQAKTRAAVGSTKAAQSASGVDVNSGSSVDVRASQAAIGQLDAMTIRTNAAREAYGYQVQSVDDTAKQNLDLMESKNDVQASQIGAATTFLGSADNAAGNFAKYQAAGGFGFGSG